jgi:hypothetical protein
MVDDKLKCVWLDLNHDNGVKYTNMKVFLPDFAGRTTNGGAQHNGEWYCQTPETMQFYNDGDVVLWWAPQGSGGTSQERRTPQHKSPDIRGPTIRSRAKMASQLVVSDAASHSASYLCNADSSHGPDFVSTHEGLFCDMGSRIVWPLCNHTDGTSTGNCFDLEARLLIHNLHSKRDSPYNRVTVWH